MARSARKKTTVYLDSEDLARLAAESARRGRLQADLVREAVHQYLAHVPKPAQPTPGLWRIEDYGFLGPADQAELFGEARGRRRTKKR